LIVVAVESSMHAVLECLVVKQKLWRIEPE
jgi:hypothetical protein